MQKQILPIQQKGSNYPCPSNKNGLTSQESIIDYCYKKTQLLFYDQINKDEIKELYHKYYQQIVKAAEQGNQKAFFLIGRIHTFGYYNNEEQNVEQSRKWYIKALERGEPHSVYNLYYMQTDSQQKKKLLIKAADMSEERAVSKLGQNYLYQHEGFEKNQELGLKYLKIVEQKKFPYSFYQLGRYYYYIKSYETAIEYLKKVYEINSDQYRDSEYYIGSSYLNLNQYNQAQTWLNGKYCKNSIKTHIALANTYGKMNRKDDQKRIFFESIMVEEYDIKNLINAYGKVTDILEQNTNWRDSLKCYEISSKLGDNQCLALCGYIYFNGLGVNKNEQKGISIMRMAHKKGSKIAEQMMSQLMIDQI